MRKWLSILLALGFAFTNVYAQYDDDDEYEEEEEPAPKKKTSSKKKEAEKPSAPSRLGFAVGFDGNSGLVSLVYDMGTGMELGLGLGLSRSSVTIDPEPPAVPDPMQTVRLIPSISYGLGKGLLNYGVGLSLGVTLEPTGGNRPDGGTSLSGYPNFYASVDLVKNVSLKLSAGINVDMPAEYNYNGNPNVKVKEMNISTAASGTITFYFL